MRDRVASLEKTKIKLLAHSKNMLNAAQSGDWEQFSALDTIWLPMLQSALEEHGHHLENVVVQVLQDNQGIKSCITHAQKHMASEMQQNTHATASLKKYLK